MRFTPNRASSQYKVPSLTEPRPLRQITLKRQDLYYILISVWSVWHALMQRICENGVLNRGHTLARIMNYKNLILLGAGTIGRGLLKIGQRQLSTFESVTVIDKRPLPRSCKSHFPSFTFWLGDAEDLDLLTYHVTRVPGKTLVIQLCSEIDSVRVRSHLGMLGAAYLDTSASCLPGKKQGTYDEVMSYTHTWIEGMCPHWICWGINPGLVEILVRRMTQNGGNHERAFDVSVYEHDQLNATTQSGRLGVAWSPEELIEEVMLTPTLEVMKGRIVQDDSEGAKPAKFRWGKEIIPCRVVAHEDIWNMGLLPQVSSARFLYAFHPRVMEILASSVADAYESLGVPEDHMPLRGAERVAVQITADRVEKCFTWKTDHAYVWERYAVNAVQYQVCRAIEVAIELLQRTHLGLMRGTYCASTLPLDQMDWELIDKAFISNSIDWRPARDFELRVVE